MPRPTLEEVSRAIEIRAGQRMKPMSDTMEELLRYAKTLMVPDTLPNGMTRRLNDNGVKDSCDMYRTFGGELYPQWIPCPSANLVKLYRAAGVKCRIVQCELFVRQIDQDKAMAVDNAIRATGKDPSDV